MLNRVKNNYTHRVEELDVINQKMLTEHVFEKLIDDVTKETPSLRSLHNDFLTAEIGGSTYNRVQVDRHIRNSKGKLVAVIEAKTYLEASMLKRLVVDFWQISKSSGVSKNVKFAIVTGQWSVSPKALSFQQELLKKLTGRRVNIFVIRKDKRRNSLPFYRQERRDLDFEELNNFNKFVAHL
jgi:hypothetical protein|tara:strand:+ start:496 stop:1041 length:546 start_codon:yes stop_codon:yes gene_type:complete